MRRVLRQADGAMRSGAMKHMPHYRFVACWLVLTLCLPVPMTAIAASVTLNATGTTQVYSSATPSPVSDTSLTVASGSDRYLFVALSSRDGDMPSLAITWNGVSMSLLNSQVQDTWTEYCYVYGLAAPATGNNTMQVSWTGGGSFRFTYRAVTLDNVSSISGSLTNGSGNSANPQGNITTASGDATVSCLTMTGSVSAVSHTLLFTDSNHGAAQYNLSSSSSDTHQYTMTSSNWGLAGVRALQTGAAAATPRGLLLGVYP